MYCPEPGADCCVRLVGTGDGGTRFEYGHQECAAKHGVRPLFRDSDTGAEQAS